MSTASRFSAGAVLALVLLAAPAARAHVGSPDVFLEESAGPYELIVIVHMPPAIPGDAEMQVRIQNGRPDEEIRVEVREVPPQGEAFAPGWAALEPSDVDPDFYATPVSLMIFGLWRAEVKITGPRGSGTIQIPLTARRPAPQALEAWFASLLAGLGGLFFVALWQILYGFGRDGARSRDESPARADVVRGRLFGAGGVTFFALIITFISMHWFVIYGQHKKLGVPPLVSEVDIQGLDGRAPRAGEPLTVALVIRNRRGEPFEDVVQEFGKDMHLNAFSVPAFSYFLHVHPKMTSPGRFEFAFTPPVDGEFLLFGDVLHTSGLVETVTNTIAVSAGDAPGSVAFPERSVLEDPVDSHSFQRALDESRLLGPAFDLGDGLEMRWVREGEGAIPRGEFRKLSFEIVDSSGRTVRGLEPLMGVEGHLTVLRANAKVYAHVRPMGTLSGRESGSRDISFANREARVGFPYGFPEPGLYRLFVRMKLNGRVYTGVFDTRVG